MKATLLSLVLIAGLTAACGKDTPSSPTPAPTPTPAPAAVTYTVSGTVRSTAGAVISGATVAVVDGPSAGRTAVSSSTGTYSLAGLQFAGFSISASAPNFIAQSRGIPLTAGVTTTTADFVLAPVVVAPPPPVVRTMTGTWTGAWSVYRFTMVLTQSGTVVTGTYTDQDGAGRTDPAEPGSFSDPTLVLRMKQGTFRDFTFRGAMDATGRRVTGTVNAAGGTTAFTMDKQ